MSDRVGPEHEHWDEALSLGMNEVLVHPLTTTKAQRLAIETRLRHLYPTPLNRQPAGIGLLSHLPRQGLMNPLAEALARPQRPQTGGILPYRSPFEAD